MAASTALSQTKPAKKHVTFTAGIAVRTIVWHGVGACVKASRDLLVTRIAQIDATGNQLLHIIDWIAQAQLVTLVKDAGAQRLRLMGIRDVFGLATALQGKSRPQVASALNITTEVADDILTCLEACPAYRLKDVYSFLSEDTQLTAASAGDAREAISARVTRLPNRTVF